MPTSENIKENAIRKIIQELIVPNLSKIINKQDILEERINSTNTRIDALKDELKADIIRLDEKMDTKITALDDKMDIKITALSEKVDYMNKTNERLFDIIFHSSEKKIAG
jgi:hypothetical protein